MNLRKKNLIKKHEDGTLAIGLHDSKNTAGTHYLQEENI